MDFKTAARHALQQACSTAPAHLAVVGLDGFVDTIVTPVALRHGQGEAFTPISTLADFGQRISAAAGKSTNIELYPRLDKLGGNGPIMANALLAQDVALNYIGALGLAAIHPVFQDMAARAEIVSLCDPSTTTAVEFEDGKLMLGQMKSLDEITYERLIECMGAAGLRQVLGAADLVALVNWTMIPNMTEILVRLVEDVLPDLPARQRHFFFDLADPEKRSRDDLLAVLRIMGRFERAGRVTLGLNLKEAQQVYSVLGFPAVREDEAGLRTMATQIREALQLATVVVHPKESAACATATGEFWVPGPYVTKPLITTGAGDHFNAGFMRGLLLGLAPAHCLVTGVCTSGHYVRTGHSPNLNDLETFLANWS